MRGNIFQVRLDDVIKIGSFNVHAFNVERSCLISLLQSLSSIGMSDATVQGKLRAFLDWFQSNGGYVDLSSMDLTDFPASEGGRGAVAVKDIPVR